MIPARVYHVFRFLNFLFTNLIINEIYKILKKHTISIFVIYLLYEYTQNILDTRYAILNFVDH
jgi:hypothetical protein